MNKLLFCFVVLVAIVNAHDYALNMGTAANRYLSVPPLIFGGGDVTIELSVHKQHGAGVLWSLGIGTGSAGSHHMYMNGNTLKIRKGSGSDVSNVNWVVPNGWAHVTAVFKCSGSSGTITIYMSGAQKATITSSHACIPRTTYNKIRIGDFNYAHWVAAGSYDNFRIWDRALTASEIATSGQSPSSFSGAKLVGGFGFNEGFGVSTAGSWSDNSGNVYQLGTKATLSGFPLPLWVSHAHNTVWRQCYGTGDPHYTSFISGRWHPQGRSHWFLFVDCCGLQLHVNQQSCVPHWASASCIRGTRLHVFGETVLWSHIGNGARSFSYSVGAGQGMIAIGSNSRVITPAGLDISIGDLGAGTFKFTIGIPLYGTLSVTSYAFHSGVYFWANSMCYGSAGICGRWDQNGNRHESATTDYWPPSNNGPPECPPTGPKPTCCAAPPDDDGFCGDGIQNGNEQCDDGNPVAGDGCDNCVAEICGDGKNNQPSEECDDGNIVSGDGCSAKCVLEFCGDGKRNSNKPPVEQDEWEQCDDGNLISGDGCGPTCQQENCGDGIVNNNGKEQCDDGNLIPGDGCNSICKNEFCGDGLNNNGNNEQCDDGNTNAGDGCGPTCQVEFCGDAVINNNGVEQCDDGNNANGDGCDSRCKNEFCGDGKLNNAGSEQCDDGNVVNGDGCNSNCQNEICGDGVINNSGHEQCDDGNVANGDGCSANCQTEVCGDGSVNNNNAEQCDDGNVRNGDGCNANCQNEICGDGIVNNGGTEQCDDGNTLSGDGCDSVCVAEVCGDGIVNNGEQCDDGGNAPHDGCSPDCIVEQCGNGFVTSGATPGFFESCDDSNVISGDGCSSKCEVEFCGDDKVNNGGTEECDDGNAECGDGCCGCVQEVCGDGTVNNNPTDITTGSVIVNENCEDGNDVDGDGCTNCIMDFCGDGTQNNAGAEECDDGNNNDFDGCDEDCVVEFCGDAVINNSGSEECDDGNSVVGDGCDDNCVIEFCGDGLINNLGTEECDDGNNVPGDGCDAGCVIEFCGDGIADNNCDDACRLGISPTQPEECDDGNNVDGDGCDAGCVIEFCGDGLINNNYEECEDGNEQEGDGCFDCVINNDDWNTFEPVGDCTWGTAADNRLTQAEAFTLCAEAVNPNVDQDKFDECMFDMCATADPTVTIGIINQLDEACLAEELRSGEVVCARRCPLDCELHGVCNEDTGECTCNAGFTGADCSNPITFRCYDLTTASITRDVFAHPTSPFASKDAAIDSYNIALRPKNSVLIYFNLGEFNFQSRLDLFIINDGLDNTAGSYDMSVSVPASDSTGSEFIPFANSGSAGSWDASTGQGSFSFNWDAYAKSGAILGPFPSIGISNRYCVDIAISNTAGIDQVLVGSGNKRHALDMISIPSSDWSSIQICSDECNDNCAALDCSACAASTECGWCVEKEECSLGNPSGPRERVCSKWRYSFDQDVNRVLTTSFGFPVNPADQDVFLSTAATTDLPVDVTVEVYDPELVVWDVALAIQNTATFNDDLEVFKVNFANLWSMLDAYPLLSMSLSTFANSPIPNGAGDLNDPNNAANLNGDFRYETNLPITPFKNANFFHLFSDTLNAISPTSVTSDTLSQLWALDSMSDATEMQYRDGTRKVVILFTDTAYGVGGGYPTVVEVRDKLLSSAIIPFFAVTSSVKSTYEDLVNQLGFGAVVDLESDSSNALQVIVDSLGVATGQVSLVVQNAGHAVSTSQTLTGLPFGSRAKFQVEMRETTEELLTTDLVSPGFGTASIENIADELPQTTGPTQVTFAEDPAGGYIIGVTGINPYWDSPVAARILTVPSLGTLYQYDASQEQAIALGETNNAAAAGEEPPEVDASGTEDDITLLRGAVISAGDMVLDEQDRVIFVPVEHDFGSAYTAFDYLTTDGCAESAHHTVTINITPVNDRPNAETQSLSTVEDTPFDITLSADDIENSDLTFKLVRAPDHGTLIMGGNVWTVDPAKKRFFVDTEIIIYEPDLNYFGPDSFDFSASDGENYMSSPATISIDVTPFNDAPTSNAVNPTITSEDTKVIIVLFTDDVDSTTDIRTIEFTSLPDKGSLFSNAGTPASSLISTVGSEITVDEFGMGRVWFVPPENEFSEVDQTFTSFTWKVKDNDALEPPSALESIENLSEIQVIAVNDKPAVPTGELELRVSEDTAGIFLCSVSDVDNEQSEITIHISTYPTNGLIYQVTEAGAKGALIDPAAPSTTWTLTNSLKQVLYEPTADEFGENYSHFSYKAFDGHLFSVPRRVEIHVNAVNDIPIGTFNEVDVLEDDSVVFDLVATDIDNLVSELTFQVTALPASGDLFIVDEDSGVFTLIESTDLPITISTLDNINNRRLAYTPLVNFYGEESFEYTATDNHVPAGVSIPVTVTIDVIPVNDLPLALASDSAGDEDTLILIQLSGFDIDFDPLTARIVQVPSEGLLFQIEDDDVTPGDDITVASVGDPVELENANNWIGYLPPPNTNNDASNDDTFLEPIFNFVIHDGTASSEEQSVSIDIFPVNDAPEVGADSSTTIYEDNLRKLIVMGGSDVDLDTLSGKVTAFNAPDGSFLQYYDDEGEFQLVVLGEVLPTLNLYFTPATDQSGDNFATVEYRVNDGELDSLSTATITINVLPVNDSPKPTLDSIISINEDAVYEFNLEGIDPEGDTFTAEITTAPIDRGTLEVQISGTYVAITTSIILQAVDYPWPMRFTPIENDYDENSYNVFAYRFDDGIELTPEYDVLITVRPINDYPEIGIRDGRITTFDSRHNITASSAEGGLYTLGGGVQFRDIDAGANPMSGSITCGSRGTVTANLDSVPNAVDDCTLTQVSDTEVVFTGPSNKIGFILQSFEYTALSADSDDSVIDDDTIIIDISDQGAFGGCEIPVDENNPSALCPQSAILTVVFDIQNPAGDELSTGELAGITGGAAAVVAGGILGAWKLKGKAAAQSEDFQPWADDWADDMVMSNPMYENDRFASNSNPFYEQKTT